MTTFSAAPTGLSYAELSQKVIGFGGFVEGIPGGHLFLDERPFVARGGEQRAEIVETSTVNGIAQKGYDEGFADGYAKAEMAMRGQLTSMQKLLVEAEALQIETTSEIAQMICDLVERLVSSICDTMPVTQQWLLDQIDKALPHIAECSEAQTLWLNPDDAALLEGVELAFDVQTDPMMPRATLQIRSSTGYLETGVSPFIQQMHDALDLSEVE